MRLTVVFGLVVVAQVCLALTEARRPRAKRSVASQLQYLLDEERSLRQRLEGRVQRLRNEANKLNATIPTSACNCQPPTRRHTTEVAYTGTLPSTMTSLTTATVFNFTADLINVGSGYNATSARFTAPVTGIYGLGLSMFMNPNYWTNLQLVHNGTAILRVKTGHRYTTYNRQVNMATNYGVFRVAAGEEVWPQYVTGSGTRLYADGVTSFTAVLLHEF